MTEHTHSKHVEGCFRCELSLDEVTDHTPTTETVKECFIDGAAGEFIPEDFDRWLRAHHAEVIERTRDRFAYGGIEFFNALTAEAARLRRGGEE